MFRVPHRPRYFWTPIILAALTGASPPVASAVIVVGGDGRNETPPTGDLLTQGWRYQGQWANIYLGTPVSPEYFITSKHVGISASFTYAKNDGTSVQYPVSVDSSGNYVYTDDSTSDLRLVKINTAGVTGAFESWAPIYTDSPASEAGKTMAVFGRGTQRGDPVLNDAGDPRGWKWGPSDFQQSWGTNTVDGVVTIGSVPYVKFDFDLDGGASQATLSNGDSGGGLFVLTDGVWKLAGINAGVEGAWKTTPGGDAFNAAIYDKGGLYQQTGNGTFVLQPDVPTEQAAAGYSTSLASRLDYIGGVIGYQYVPEPGQAVYVLTTALAIFGRRRRPANSKLARIRNA